MDITNNDRKPEQISSTYPNNNFPTKCNCPYVYNYDNRPNGNADFSSPELDNYRPTPGGGYQGHGGNQDHGGNYGHGGNQDHGGNYGHGGNYEYGGNFEHGWNGGYYNNDYNYGNLIFPFYYQYPYPYYDNDYYSSYQY